MTTYQFYPLEFKEYPAEEMVERSRFFYDVIKRRRTVRAFSARPVPVDVIENALRAAGSAPSGANLQPWQFTVVLNPEVKKQIRAASEAVERKLYNEVAPEAWLSALAPLATDENKPFLETAPCLIVVSAKKYIPGPDGQKQKVYYPSESVGIATGILLTALHLSGLATLTYTPSPMNFLNRILNRPEHERPFLIVVAGFPADNATVPVIEKYPLEQISEFIV